MARGTSLYELRQMLKAELRLAMQGGNAVDVAFNYLLWNTQVQFATENDWDFLILKADVAASSRYPTLPTTINFDRPVKVEVSWGDLWRPITAGIGAQEYNAVNEGDAQDPIQRWALSTGGLFEVWPVPVEVQVIRFTGQKALTSWRDANGNWVDKATCELDDRLLVLFAAADEALRTKKPDAAAKLELARRRFVSLRSNAAATPSRRCILGTGDKPALPVVPIRILTTA